jgi:hypothetical protein
MRPYGKVNVVTLLFLAAIVGGGYFAFTHGPVYIDNLEVREAVAAAYNQAPRSTDDQVRAGIRERVRKMGTHMERDQFGVEREVPGLGLRDDQIVIERNTVTNTVRITVEYEREIELKPFKRTKVIRFREEKEGPLNP